jgi:hypothetical protein
LDRKELLENIDDKIDIDSDKLIRNFTIEEKYSRKNGT